VFGSTLPERTPFTAAGKMVMECAIETKANMILRCIDGLRGDLHVTFEEGSSAAWLYDLLKPHVTELIVCDPRKNASMREDSQNDKILFAPPGTTRQRPSRVRCYATVDLEKVERR
jgi:hypothetical protein